MSTKDLRDMYISTEADNLGFENIAFLIYRNNNLFFFVFYVYKFFF